MTSFVNRSDYDVVARIARAGTGVRQGMEELLAACDARLPHSVWQHLLRLEVDGDVALLREWLQRLLDVDPVPGDVNGLTSEASA